MSVGRPSALSEMLAAKKKQLANSNLYSEIKTVADPETKQSALVTPTVSQSIMIPKVASTNLVVTTYSALLPQKQMEPIAIPAKRYSSFHPPSSKQPSRLFWVGSVNSDPNTITASFIEKLNQSPVSQKDSSPLSTSSQSAFSTGDDVHGAADIADAGTANSSRPPSPLQFFSNLEIQETVSSLPIERIKQSIQSPLFSFSPEEE